jgi:hypothetical protein
VTNRGLEKEKVQIKELALQHRLKKLQIVKNVATLLQYHKNLPIQKQFLCAYETMIRLRSQNQSTTMPFLISFSPKKCSGSAIGLTIALHL